MLDTCICIYLIRNKSRKMQKRFESFQIGDLYVSSVTEAELRYGAEKSANPDKNHSNLDRFFLTLPVLNYDRAASREYGKIRLNLEKKGTPIGPYDMLIASHAKSLNLVLVTNNSREFTRIPDLRVEDWVIP